MDELIKQFIANGGKPLEIRRDNKLLWLSYASMTAGDFIKMEELNFVFVKTKRKVIDYYYPEHTYKTYLWGFIKIKIDSKQIPVYKEIEEIVLKAKPPRKTLQGK